MFLNEFLGALGAIKIEYSSISKNTVYGTVFYDLVDAEEKQKFCWHISEDDIPSEEVHRLVKLLKDESILSIDQISVTRDELLERYNNKFACKIEKVELINILNELELIEVPMIDDGRETDVYFIHE